MLIKLSTEQSVTEAAASLQVAVEANRFGVMHIHNLQETMLKKGVDFNRECLIFQGYLILNMEPRIHSNDREF
jgi:hypothetical protein